MKPKGKQQKMSISSHAARGIGRDVRKGNLGGKSTKSGGKTERKAPSSVTEDVATERQKKSQTVLSRWGIYVVIGD